MSSNKNPSEQIPQGFPSVKSSHFLLPQSKCVVSKSYQRFLFHHNRSISFQTSPKQDTDNKNVELQQCVKGDKTLTSVFSHWRQLWELPSSSAGHGGTGGAGLHGAAARMRST